MTQQIVAIVIAALAAALAIVNLVLALRARERLEQHHRAFDETAAGAEKLAWDLSNTKRDVERYTTDVVEMKSKMGRRLAELRLEKERILGKRGPVAWFARELGWHIRPDQWGTLASLLSAAQLEHLLGLFDCPDDPQVIARWDDLGGDGDGGVVSILRSVLDEKQVTSLARLTSMIGRFRLRTPGRPTVVQ